MLNPLKFLRYLVFVVFVICNAIITSVAVWNLSILQVITVDVVAKDISSYLIFVGASGLVVIFIVLFFELLGGKSVFFGRVWFELLWVGLFCMMELAGAGAITTQGNSSICSSNLNASDSACASTQVLQAFTWICGILLFGYLVLLFVSAKLQDSEDHRIWRRSVRKFLWHHHTRKSVPVSTASLPRFRTTVPIIAAPRPRRVIAIPEAHLSGLGDYDVEHYQPPAPRPTEFSDRLVSPPVAAVSLKPTRIPLQPQPRQTPCPLVSTPFYPAHVQAAIDPSLQRPSAAHLTPVRQLPLAPSPPPLGDWPRRDATSQPARVKRKPTIPSTPTPYSFTMPAAVQQHPRQPLATPPTTRARPSGPRLRSNSGENHRPPNLDL